MLNNKKLDFYQEQIHFRLSVSGYFEAIPTPVRITKYFAQIIRIPGK